MQVRLVGVIYFPGQKYKMSLLATPTFSGVAETETFYVRVGSPAVAGVASVQGISGLVGVSSTDSSITVGASGQNVVLTTTGNALAPSTVSASGAISGATLTGTTSITTPTLVLNRPVYGFGANTAVPLVVAGVAQTGVSGFAASGPNIPNTTTWTTIFSWAWSTLAGGAFADANLVKFILSGSSTDPYGNTLPQSTSSGVQPCTVVISDQITGFNSALSPAGAASLTGDINFQLANGSGQAFTFPNYGLNGICVPLVDASPKSSPTMYFRGIAGGGVVFNNAATSLYLHAVIVC